MINDWFDLWFLSIEFHFKFSILINLKQIVIDLLLFDLYSLSIDFLFFSQKVIYKQTPILKLKSILVISFEHIFFPRTWTILTISRVGTSKKLRQILLFNVLQKCTWVFATHKSDLINGFFMQKWFDYFPETLNHITSIDNKDLIQKFRKVVLSQTDQNVNNLLKLLIHKQRQSNMFQVNNDKKLIYSFVDLLWCQRQSNQNLFKIKFSIKISNFLLRILSQKSLRLSVPNSLYQNRVAIFSSVIKTPDQHLLNIISIKVSFPQSLEINLLKVLNCQLK